jgi:hypothetical protein
MRRARSCGGGGGVVAVVAVVAVGRLRRYGRHAASSSSRATHACRAIEAHSRVGVDGGLCYRLSPLGHPLEPVSVSGARVGVTSVFVL